MTELFWSNTVDSLIFSSLLFRECHSVFKNKSHKIMLGYANRVPDMTLTRSNDRECKVYSTCKLLKGPNIEESAVFHWVTAVVLVLICLKYVIPGMCFQRGSGAPAREAVVSEDEQKAMMAYYYKKQEEFKVRNHSFLKLNIYSKLNGQEFLHENDTCCTAYSIILPLSMVR